MIILIITIIVLVAIILMIKNPNNIQIKENNSINLSKFEAKQYVMTETELKFYRELKKIADKLEMSIFPQVDLERIVKVKDNNLSDRNRIKSRSIDYTIVSNKNCKIICCIELDDYSHNREYVKEKDKFKDDLFKQVNIPLHRIKVSNYYNLEKIEEKIKENVK